MASSKFEVDLPVEAGGLKLRNPFIVGSGPCTKSVGQLVEAERCGWAAASIKLSMDPSPYVNLPPRYRWLSKEGYHVFTAETRLDVEAGLRLMREARRCTGSLVLFANMAYTGEEGLCGWVRMAEKFADAGAHAIELNLCCPNMSFNVAKSSGGASALPPSGASLGSDPVAVRGITRAVKAAVDVPVISKITPEGGNIAEVAQAAFEGGADAVTSVGNRLGIPPFDPADPAGAFYRAQRGMSLGCISGPLMRPFALRDVFEIRKRVGPDRCIIGMGGVAGAEDAIRFTMCGADLIGICTETMLRGFRLLAPLVREVRAFLDERGVGDWRGLRDSLHPYMLGAHELAIAPAHAEVDAARCTGCGRCLGPAHCVAISLEKKKARVDVERCLACSTCVDLCPSGAIRIVEERRPSRSRRRTSLPRARRKR
ncbi:MAG: 4Fe-4S binding protein [Planctomycetota bacterium]